MLSDDCTGRYLMLYRTGPGMTNNFFYINEVRVFSVPNLLVGAAVTEAPDPKHSDFGANNLVENTETRSST